MLCFYPALGSPHRNSFAILSLSFSLFSCLQSPSDPRSYLLYDRACLISFPTLHFHGLRDYERISVTSIYASLFKAYRKMFTSFISMAIDGQCPEMDPTCTTIARHPVRQFNPSPRSLSHGGRTDQV